MKMRTTRTTRRMSSWRNKVSQRALRLGLTGLGPSEKYMPNLAVGRIWLKMRTVRWSPKGSTGLPGFSMLMVMLTGKVSRSKKIIPQNSLRVLTLRTRIFSVSW